ncbi:methylglyoxal synthase [Rhodoferax saidenbachensis]|uniref:Methylglyoxal synthase n=1 Tax=Rhodoferax saidenbachensis TaxID=1484693 RepID=A0A1P8KCL0_9BURK|nr:methylglyoxal synthase [Rhodoferax saidenbachensis]APW43752.1 methylglyoxal synthase [Rhodoferax saidenbachensis]
MTQAPAQHRPPRIALIAHDHKKDTMVELAREFAPFLTQCTLSATGTTGRRLIAEVGLTVECMLSGPWGGDLQIGSRLSQGEVDVVIFLRDPMTPQPHEPDINALVRACDVHDVPCATNLSSARLLLKQLAARV